VMVHCQDYALVSDGVMHEGFWSTSLGLRGWPASGEDMIVARNILLAELTGAHVHCQHLSTARSVELIRAAKKRGVKTISGEACPHHFTLTDAAIAGSEKFWTKDGDGVFWAGPATSERPTWPVYDTNFKMNPPLRSKKDQDLLVEALKNGTLDAIATDHAPHTTTEKEMGFIAAPCGIIGLETAFALCLERLSAESLPASSRMTVAEVVRKFTSDPARILGLAEPKIAVEATADLCLFDPEMTWTYEVNKATSKSNNSPFDGREIKGRTILTLCEGKVAYQFETATSRWLAIEGLALK